jgi:CelD/BcsL family acetyltransferase involved in cellulose biosynthesis
MSPLYSLLSGQAEALAPEWNELYRLCPSATPFQRPEWLLAWVRAFLPRDVIFIETRQNGRLIGLAPLLVYPRGQDCVLAFAGGGVSDYLTLLCAPGLENQVVDSMLKAALTMSTWNFLEFTDIPRGSPLLDLPVFQGCIREHDLCSVLNLPSDDLVQTFSKRQRANLRNAHSRLLRAGGGEVELASPQTAPDFIEDLFRLHACRWSQVGQAGVLHDPQVRKFHEASAAELIRDGILKIHRLRVKDSTAAVLYSLWDRETVFCYMQGFDPQWSGISPGTLLMFSVMKEATTAGMRRFDFLRGQEPYKQHWRPRPAATYCVAVTRRELEARLSLPATA